jgi:RNA polymerase sigma-70 factor (ECF subfamily)
MTPTESTVPTPDRGDLTPAPAAPDPEFSRLFRQATAGDERALSELARRYEAKVRVVARVLLGRSLRPYLDSVDLVQSVHQSVLIGIRNQKFDIADPEKLTALAITVVRRKVARHWRRVQRQQRLSSGPSEPSGLADAVGILDGQTEPSADPAAQSQYGDQLQHITSRLSPDERRMLDLRMQGYNSAEIAAELSLSPVNVRVRLTRLRQRLETEKVCADWL